MSSSRVVAGATGATGAASTGVEDTTTGAGAAATSALGAAALRVAFFTGAASTGATTTGASTTAATAAAFFATRGVFAGAVFIIPGDEILEDIFLRTNDFLVKSLINFFRNNQLFLIIW